MTKGRKATMAQRTSSQYCKDTRDPDGSVNRRCNFRVRGANHHAGAHHKGIVAAHPRKGHAKRT